MPSTAIDHRIKCQTRREIPRDRQTRANTNYPGETQQPSAVFACDLRTWRPALRRDRLGALVAGDKVVLK